MVPVKGYFPQPGRGDSMDVYNELLFHYYVSWCCHQMQIAQSFVFWELKNLFGVARELNGKAPHHPSPHADEKVA